MDRIGLFGGTFDPPHLGHSILAAEARSALNLDRVLWILTPISPHKLENKISPLAQRIDLLQAALTRMPEFEFSDVDITRAAPYYAIDTLRKLQNLNPGAELIYIMGSDSLLNLPGWFDAQSFVNEIAEIGVLHRPGVSLNIDKVEEKLPGVKTKVSFFKAPLIEISGQEIRYRIQNKLPYKYFLLPSVYDCINEKKYYREVHFAD